MALQRLSTETEESLCEPLSKKEQKTLRSFLQTHNMQNVPKQGRTQTQTHATGYRST